jgi:RNA polymerase sigma factor (sigma-70 family)
MVLAICRDDLGGVGAGANAGAGTVAPADAFQATFLVLLRRAATIRDGRQLGSWLRLTARRVCSNARRRAGQARAAGPLLGVDPADPSAPSPLAQAQDRETITAVRDELTRLPAPFRDALVLTHLDGLTHEQAAEVLGCPLGTVRSRVARGRERLRARLKRRGLRAVVLPPGPPRLAPAELPPSSLDAVIRLLSHPAASRVEALAAVGRSWSGLVRVAASIAALAGVAATVAAVASGVIGPPRAARLALPSSSSSSSFTHDDPIADALDRAVADLPALAADDRDQAVWNLIELGALRAATGKPEAARRSFQSAFELARRQEPGDHRGGTLARLGRNQAAVGDLDKARVTLGLARDDLLPRARSAGDPAVYELRTLSGAQARLGDMAGLEATLDRLRALAAPAPGDLDETDPVNRARTDLVWALARAGRADEALQAAIDPIGSGLALPAPPEAPPGIDEPRRRRSYADIPLQLHRISALRALFEALVPEQGPSGRAVLDRVVAWLDANPKAVGDTASVLTARGLAAVRLGDLDGAQRVLERFGPTGGGSDRVVLAIRLAQARQASGDRDGAVALLRQALDTFPPGPASAMFRPRVVQALREAGDFDRLVIEARRMPVLEAPEAVRDLMAAARGYEAAGNAPAAAEARQAAHALAQARCARDEAEPVPPAAGLSMRDENGDPMRAHDTPSVRLSYGRKRLAELAEALGETAEADRLAAAIPTPSLRDATRRQLAIDRAVALAAADLEALDDLSIPLDARLDVTYRLILRQAERAGVHELVTRSVQP